MGSLPVFKESIVIDEDFNPCEGCAADSLSGQCKRVPIVRWDPKGSIVNPTDPVELLVVADPPSSKDNSLGQFWGDRDGKTILNALKSSGAKSFAVVPAVRCYPGDQIDHFILDKKYRNERRDARPRAIDIARDCVKNCSGYVNRALWAFNPRRTLAIGALASEALGMGTNIAALRQTPLHPKRGLAIADKTEGTIVTWDRAYARVSKWAESELLSDLYDRLPSIQEIGFATERGDHSTIEQINLDTVEKVERFVSWCLDPSNKDLKKSWRPYPEAVDENGEPDEEMRAIRFPELMSFDFETAGLEFSKERNKILNVGISFTSDEDRAFVIPLQHPETPFSPDDLEEVFSHLKRLFQGKGARFFGYLAHNAQFETGIIKAFFDVWLGEDGKKPILDSMILAYLQNETRHSSGINRPYSLETLAQSYIGFRWYAESKMKSKRDSLSEESLESVNEYVGIDAAATARLTNQILDFMVDEGSLSDLMRVATHLYSPAILYTVDMKMAGQTVNIDLLLNLRSSTSSIVSRIAEIKKEFDSSPKVKKALSIVQQRGKKGSGMSIKPVFQTSAVKNYFDINSPDHRRALFWDVCKLKGADTSVDRKFQDRYKDREPLVALFQEYQQLSKLDTAYLAPLAEHVQRSADFRVHPSFNLTKTATGRLSASNPNTQQLPRGDTRDKKQIKSLYTVPEDKIMVQLDFSQAEVRWLGIMSGDENLSRRYARAMELEEALRKDPTNKELQRAVKIEGDLHMSTAIDMYRLDKDTVVDPVTGGQTKAAKLKRQAAKAVCFGLIYGKSAKSLAGDLGISDEEADDAVEKWMAQFPQAAEWLAEVDRSISKTCVARSPFGRWRRLPEARSNDMSVANRARRQARNTPIQAAASDFCIYAACRLREALLKHPDPRLREQTKLINTVHDSLGAEVPADIEVVWEYMNISKNVFTDPNLIKKDFGVVATVPLQVDFDIGLNWGNVVGVSLDKEELREVMHDAEVLRQQPAGTLLSDLAGKGILYAELNRG